jgi:hypothetical protein
VKRVLSDLKARNVPEGLSVLIGRPISTGIILNFIPVLVSGDFDHDARVYDEALLIG